MFDSREIEERVISAALNDPDCMERMIADCDSSMFADMICRSTFITASNLSKEGKIVSFQTITKKMNANETSELVRIFSDVYSLPSLFDDALSDLRQAATNRELSLKLAELKARAEGNDGDVVSDAFAATEKILLKDTDKAKKKKNGQERVYDAFLAIQKQQNKIRTGFLGIDSEIGGYAQGSLNIIGGRPSMGKSTFAMNVALNILNRGENVGYFTFEDSEEILIQRMIAAISKTSLWNILHDNSCAEKAERAANVLAKHLDSSLFISDATRLTTSKIRSVIRCWDKRCGGLDAVFLDYLGYIQPDDEGKKKSEKTRAQQIGDITKELKRIAKELDCPVILLCQLNRGADNADQPPKMSDLKESGDIEQDADTIMYLNRPWVQDHTRDKEEAYAVFVKNRNGSIGTVRLKFNGSIFRFESYDDIPKEWKDEQVDSI